MRFEPSPRHAPSSFLAKVGTVALTAVKHVPTRMVLWGFIGLVAGSVCVALSYATGVWVMSRGAMILGYLALIPFTIVLLGTVIFGVHGLHRGAARAALALEKQFGLVSHVVEKVMTKLNDRFGERLANLPLQQLETALKEIVASYLASKDEEGRDIAAYVVRRARVAIVVRIETYLMAAYREELVQEGSGGGVSVAKLHERVSGEISTRLGDIVMSPLNKQLAVLLTLYVLLAAGWWFWLYLIILGIGGLAGSGQ